MMPNLSARPPGPSPLEDVAEPDQDVAVEDVAEPDQDVADQAVASVGAPTALPTADAVSAPIATPAAAVLSAAAPMDTAHAVRPQAVAHVPLTAQLGMPTSSAEVREFVRQAAIDRGVDPDVAVRVVLSEGGVSPATWVGDHGSSFGPLQLHYGGVASGGNAVAGLGDAFTAETHLNARDLSTWRQQVQWALDRAARDGWGAWHGAAAAGIGSRQGIGVVRPPGAGTLGPAGSHPHVNVPNQFAANLSVQEAYAACGPAAAVAVARFLGRSPTVAEALQQARQVGWTAQGGMNGIANEKRLLDAMHIGAQIETSLNWRHVQTDASRGTPVIVSTPNHYWVIDDYDPVTREYHVGQSGLAFRGGADWMTAERIQQLGGGANGALYIANPLARQTAQVVTMRLDAGWNLAARSPTAAPTSAKPPLDPGWRPLDPGSRPLDPGSRPVDAGARPLDPGSRPLEPVSLPLDPGARPRDPGARPLDPGWSVAGAPPASSAAPPPSATPATAAGTAVTASAASGVDPTPPSGPEWV